MVQKHLRKEKVFPWTIGAFILKIEIALIMMNQVSLDGCQVERSKMIISNMGGSNSEKPSWKYTKLSQYYSLISILIGVALVSVSITPFHNTDTDLEYDTAQAVINWGMPYNPSYGKFLNQPPFGFYTEAAFFKLFGSSFENGILLITAFGIATTLLVYMIGNLWYGKRTGLLAAALFGFAPWQIILSRSFLIDVQCLFLSLLFLLVGMLAINKRSFKLIIISGVFFAAAFLTKFYVLYALIPLIIYYLYSRPKSLKENSKWIVAFLVPLLLGFVLWYQVISGQGLLAPFSHEDLAFYNSDATSPFFVVNFLEVALGTLLLLSAALSFALSFSFRKYFEKIVIFDLTCLVTIVAAIAINVYLGYVANLSSPYMNPIKYVYQALPYFCLLAASLVGKSVSLVNLGKSKQKLQKLGFLLLVTAVFLVTMSLYRNMDYSHQFSTWDYFLFRTQPNALGYSFFHPNPITNDSPLMVIQYTGFGVAVSGLLWAGRSELSSLPRHFRRKA